MSGTFTMASMSTEMSQHALHLHCLLLIYDWVETWLKPPVANKRTGQFCSYVSLHISALPLSPPTPQQEGTEQSEEAFVEQQNTEPGKAY